MIESNFNKDLERKIDLYINGKLTKEQTDELWAELIQDEYYLDYAKSVANLKAIIVEERTEQEKAPTHTLRKIANYGVAAAIAMIIGVIGVLNFTSNNSNDTTIDALGWIEYDTYRSSNDSPAITDNEAIKQAIRLANDGNTEEAILLLSNELERSTDANEIAELSLTLGSIQYNYGEYYDALESFRMVVNQENVNILILEKGYWYLGNTLLQLDETIEAEIAFQNTLELDGQYSRIVQRYLEMLNTGE